MTMGHHQHTATILPFPGRARSPNPPSSLGSGRTGKSGSETQGPRVAQAYFAESGYHQAAVDEASQTRKP